MSIECDQIMIELDSEEISVVTENPDIPDAIIVKPEAKKEIIVRPPDEPKKEELEKDFQYTRENLTEIIKTGREALEILSCIAANDQKARSFEVVAKLIQTIAEANRDLIALHKDKKDVAGGTSEDKSTVSQTNNIIFSGTTAEMAALVKELKK